MSSVSSLNSLLSSSSSSDAAPSLDLSSILAAATGASSVGIDVTSAVDAAIYAARAPERIWQSQQTTLQSQTSALTSIQTALASVTTDLGNLNDPAGVLATKSVSSTNSSAVSATATADAVSGTHNISVQDLATAASWYSASVPSANGSVGTSTFQITLGDGTSKQFALGQSGLNSLSTLASSINAANLGIRASVVSDATGSRISLVSQSTGSSSNFSVLLSASGESSWNSASATSATAALGSGSIEVGDGTQNATISIAAGTNLNAVAAQINQSGLNLNASVVTDTNGAHLSIVGTSDGSVTVSSDPVLSLVQSSVGQNAQLKVDGVPVVSTSNSVTGAIPGVTLNLLATTTGQATLQVSPDADQISAAVSQFVTDYNSALASVNAQFTYSTSTSSEGALGSDPTVRSLQSALLNLTAYSPSGSASSGNTSTLSSLGITVANDGSLTLDTATLEQTLTANPTAVQDFFQGDSLNGFASKAQTAFESFSSSGSGALVTDLSSLQQENNDLQSSISNFESNYIASQQTILTQMYSQAETALQQLPATLKQISAQLGSGNSGD